MKTRKYIDYIIIFVSLMLLVIFVSTIVVALEELPPKTDNDPTIIKYTPTEPAPQWVVDKVNNYLISLVGENYFDEHIYIIKNITSSGGGYIITYNYTHNLKDNPSDIPYQVGYKFEVRTDSRGELVGRRVIYTGPREPYQFLISNNEARDIAIQNGMEEPAIELYYGGQGYDSDTPIPEGSYVWVAWTAACVPSGNADLLFINVDNGEIMGRRISEGAGCMASAGGIVNKSIGFNLMEGEQNLTLSSKEETNILQKIINWIKLLFTK